MFLTFILKKRECNSRLKLVKNQTGFTIIEMMIAITLAFIVIAGIYEVFTSQQKAYNIQDQVAEMQQNARVALDMMTREIHMMGYDPRLTAYTPIATNTINSIRFYADLDESGDNPPAGTDEDITFSYDAVNSQITRDNGGGAQPMVENIVSLQFEYGLDIDGNGAINEVNAAANDDEWVFNNAGDSVAATIASQGGTGTINTYLSLIKITITARTAREDPDFTTGFNLSGTAADGTCRTRILTANIKPRNLRL